MCLSWEFSRVWCLQPGCAYYQLHQHHHHHHRCLPRSTSTLPATHYMSCPLLHYGARKKKRKGEKIIAKTTLYIEESFYQSRFFFFLWFTSVLFCVRQAVNNSCGVLVPKQLITVGFQIKTLSRHL